MKSSSISKFAQQSLRTECHLPILSRRDGSPFMNLLMIAPLCDSRGKIRYFIGAQVDVSGLVQECYDLESLKRLIIKEDDHNGSVEEAGNDKNSGGSKKDEFQDLSEMLNMQELEIVRRFGGRMHREQEEEVQESSGHSANWNKTRLLIHEGSPNCLETFHSIRRPGNGKLSGVYEHYLLVRPYPSLKILFASPSLRVPGILQSSFMSKIGGSSRVREELTQALADGRGVTAKIRWVSKHDLEGRNRWIHCTPLIGCNGAIGVWMVVIVDDEREDTPKKYRTAPPVDPRFGRPIRLREDDQQSLRSESLRDFAMTHGGRGSTAMDFTSNRPPTAQSTAPSVVNSISYAGSQYDLGQ